MMRLKIGSRAQVMHGNAKMTTGGLKKKNLKYNKRGKIVSRKASILAKKNNRLVKSGFVTKKGVFGVVMNGGSNKYNKVRKSGNYKEFYKIKMKNKNLNNDMKALYKNMHNILVSKVPNNINWTSLNKNEKKSLALQTEVNRLGNIINKQQTMYNTYKGKFQTSNLPEQIRQLRNKKSRIEKEINNLSPYTNENALKELSEIMKDTHL